MKFLTSIAFSIYLSLSAQAALFVSVQSGNWTDVNTWEQDGVAPASRTPAQGDTIIISAGDIVEVTANLDFRTGAAMYIQIEGTLEFPNGGARLRLAAGSGVKVITGGQVLPSGPGGGSSRVIEIGGTTVWRAGDGTLPGPSDLGTTPTIPLPVSWVDVFAEQIGKTVRVNWVTANETDNSHFDVFVSGDAQNWTKLGSIESKDGGLYSFVHNKPESGVNYYQIRQYDLNNRSSLSPVVSVTVVHTLSLQVFPNPCHEFLNISGIENSIVDIVIFNMHGQIMQSKTVNTSGALSLDIGNLDKGSYLIQISGSDFKESFRILKN